MFMDGIKKQEKFVKKAQDEVQEIKTELSKHVKKDAGNYNQRDFTDDIYNREQLSEAQFVEGSLHHG